MFNQLGRTIAVISCTIVFSGTCLLSAVGPAQAGVTAPSTAARVAA